MDEKIILITGASSGLGEACAKFLFKKGCIVYGTSRNVSKSNLSKKDTFVMVQMDVNDEKSVKKAVASIIEKEGRIDVVVNNAGWGVSGSIEDIEVTDAKNLFETNFFGTLRVIKEVLPLMRKQKKGKIINISSIGGVLGLPFQGLYSATKFAIEGMTEALRMEVKSFGIDVVLVEPGDFKTGFTASRKKARSSDSSSVYYSASNTAHKIFENDEQNGSDPILVAKLVDKIIHSSNPKLRYRVGSFSQKFIASMKGVMSDRVVQWILMKYYKLH